MEGQMSFFDYSFEDLKPKELSNYKIHNKVRLIELFAGVGSQAMAKKMFIRRFKKRRNHMIAEIITLFITIFIGMIFSLMLAPLLFPTMKEIYGHYYTTQTTIYVSGTQKKGIWMIEQRCSVTPIKVPCNHILMWYQQFLPFKFVKMQNPKTTYEFQNEEVKRIWEKAKEKPCANVLIQL